MIAASGPLTLSLAIVVMRSGRPSALAKASRLRGCLRNRQARCRSYPTQHYLKRAASRATLCPMQQRFWRLLRSRSRLFRSFRQKFGADLFGMLAERRHRAVAGLRACHNGAGAGIADRAGGRVEIDAPQMRMARQQSTITDARKSDVGLLPALPSAARHRSARTRAPTCASVSERLLDPRAVGGEARVAAERGIAQHLVRQHPPFAIVLDRDQDVGAVPAGKRRRARSPHARARCA